MKRKIGYPDVDFEVADIEKKYENVGEYNCTNELYNFLLFLKFSVLKTADCCIAHSEI